jgi:1-hydroxycarotenoid 3,4-desaturase
MAHYGECEEVTMSRTSSAVPKVVIVGGGMGGLTAALECAAHGADVSLFEKNDRIGGKIFAADIDGRRIDMGPTVLTMRWVFDTIFRDVNFDFEEHVRLAPAEVIARHAWEDGSKLDIFADDERTMEAVAGFSSPNEADRYLDFTKYAKRVYTHAFQTFMASESPRMKDMAAAAGPSGLLSMFRIDPFRTMHRALLSFFKDKRLIQLFARYATYYGASPYAAPATLHLIAHVEKQGVWLPRDGMCSLADAVKKAAQSLGATFHLHSGVRRICTEGGRVKGVFLDNDEFVPAEAVVFNGDAAALAAGGLGDDVRHAVRKTSPKYRSLSALVTAFVGRAEGFALSSHNVFFPSGDYRKEFDDIFRKRRLPSEPAVYMRAQDRDAGNSPSGDERFFTIINAPALVDTGGAPSSVEIERCIEAQEKLFLRAGLKIVRRSETRRMSPLEFAGLFPHTGGAIYGPLTHGPFAALKREGCRTKIPGLYLAGGSVHPGAGVPMAALSGRQAARAVLLDSGLNAPCPLRDMLGGILTA